MGTNYYLHENVCAHCGRSDDPLHIGKSSAGWCFGLHVIPEEGLTDLRAWQERWARGGEIRDEIGTVVSPEEMMAIITDRRWNYARAWTASEYNGNNAEPGPNGLVRHRVGRYCLGHGAGTWDLIPGEFS